MYARQITRALLIVGLIGQAPALHAGQAPQYPERPVRLIVGFPPGGTTDTIARIIAPRFSDALQRSWVIDNRGGAGGNIATEIAAKAAPDGHTVLLVVSNALTSNPLLYKLSIDVERDLEPIVLMATAQYMLTVHASVKATNVKEFVTLARSQAGQMNYASTGIGTPQHLAFELFKMRAGIDLVHVPYKGGGPAAAALLANEVPVMFGSLPALLQHVRSARLRGLAVSGAARARAAPDMPTVAESGYSGFEATSWYGLLVPAKTPASIVDLLHRTARSVLELPEVRQAIQSEGLEITYKDPRQFAQHIKTERAVIADVVKAARIKIE